MHAAAGVIAASFVAHWTLHEITSDADQQPQGRREWMQITHNTGCVDGVGLTGFLALIRPRGGLAAVQELGRLQHGPHRQACAGQPQLPDPPQSHVAPLPLHTLHLPTSRFASRRELRLEEGQPGALNTTLFIDEVVNLPIWTSTQPGALGQGAGAPCVFGLTCRLLSKNWQ